jgi:mannose-6-phosphate isomerase-like protein (cupin superfamily)
MRKINLGQAFGAFSDHWSPKVIGELNNSLIMIVKIWGQFDWHHHDMEHELFLVVGGKLRMGLRSGHVDPELEELIIIPHGV